MKIILAKSLVKTNMKRIRTRMLTCAPFLLVTNWRVLFISLSSSYLCIVLVIETFPNCVSRVSHLLYAQTIVVEKWIYRNSVTFCSIKMPVQEPQGHFLYEVRSIKKSIIVFDIQLKRISFVLNLNPRKYRFY
jgi:hypothetical protein